MTAFSSFIFAAAHTIQQNVSFVPSFISRQQEVLRNCVKIQKMKNRKEEINDTNK